MKEALSLILNRIKGLFVQGVILVLVCCEVYGQESIPPAPSPQYLSIHCLVFYTIAGYSSVRLCCQLSSFDGGAIFLRRYRGPLSGSINVEADLI